MPNQSTLTDHLKRLEEIALELQKAPEDLQKALDLHDEAQQHIVKAKSLLEGVQHELGVRGVELPPDVDSGS